MNWSSIAMLVGFWALGFYLGFKFGYTHGWRECVRWAQEMRKECAGSAQ